MTEEPMDQQLSCELNLALIPETELANRQISFSKQMADRYPPIIQLNGATPRLAFAPHITLYQVPVPVRYLPEMQASLFGIAARPQQFPLNATQFGADAAEV